MDPRAFFNFKNNANISRTLVKNNFKPKFENITDKRKKEVIRQFEEDAKIKETLKRLGKELEVLKTVNKSMYMV
jgi:hypothetical protein